MKWREVAYKNCTGCGPSGPEPSNGHQQAQESAQPRGNSATISFIIEWSIAGKYGGLLRYQVFAMNSETQVKKYLKVHGDVVQEIERSTGSRPEPYKDLEENVLSAYFDTLQSKKDMNGLDFITDILSSLVLDQALPNANHRTALFLIGTILTQNGFEIDTVQHSKTIQEYFLDSKHILKKARKNYKEQHFTLTKTFLEKILGSAQSGRLGSIFAYSLMNSLAASSKDLGFF